MVWEHVILLLLPLAFIRTTALEVPLTDTAFQKHESDPSSCRLRQLRSVTFYPDCAAGCAAREIVAPVRMQLGREEGLLQAEPHILLNGEQFDHHFGDFDAELVIVAPRTLLTFAMLSNCKGNSTHHEGRSVFDLKTQFANLNPRLLIERMMIVMD